MKFIELTALRQFFSILKQLHHRWSHPALVSLKVNAPPVISGTTITPTTAQQNAWLEDGGGSDSISRVDMYTKAYWPFEKSTGSTVYDQTAYSYDMSLQSAVRVSTGNLVEPYRFRA